MLLNIIQTVSLIHAIKATKRFEQCYSSALRLSQKVNEAILLIPRNKSDLGQRVLVAYLELEKVFTVGKSVWTIRMYIEVMWEGWKIHLEKTFRNLKTVILPIPKNKKRKKSLEVIGIDYKGLYHAEGWKNHVHIWTINIIFRTFHDEISFLIIKYYK